MEKITPQTDAWRVSKVAVEANLASRRAFLKFNYNWHFKWTKMHENDKSNTSIRVAAAHLSVDRFHCQTCCPGTFFGYSPAVQRLFPQVLKFLLSPTFLDIWYEINPLSSPSLPAVFEESYRLLNAPTFFSLYLIHLIPDDAVIYLSFFRSWPWFIYVPLSHSYSHCFFNMLVLEE